jgi:hypothetical protein
MWASRGQCDRPRRSVALGRAAGLAPDEQRRLTLAAWLDRLEALARQKPYSRQFGPPRAANSLRVGVVPFKGA